MIPRFVILLPAVVFSVPAVASPAPTLDVLAADASCLIMESETIALTSAVPGTLASVEVAEGDVVRRGQSIAALESSVERATAEVARARAESDVIERRRVREVAAAEVRLDRQRQLRDRNVTADQVVEDAETEVEVARLGVEEARFEREVARLEYERTLAVLQRREIRSPINGVVTRVDLSAGENVDAAAPVAVVSRVDPLEVEVYLPLAAYRLVEPGLGAEIRPQEPIGGAYRSVVASRSPIVDAASGLFRVTVSLPNPGNGIPAGIRCAIRFFDD